MGQSSVAYQLDLALHSLSHIGRGGDHRKCAHTLTVEAHVLGEGLCEQQLQPSIQEQPNGEGILLQVATGKALPRKKGYSMRIRSAQQHLRLALHSSYRAL